jgi:predicted unusual protein kinase regulating ubiquinone biosynthesis (AarF/ABC1/UbiB family)
MSDNEKKDSDNHKPATKGRRFFKLAGMTAYVMGNYAKTRVGSWFRSEEEDEIARHESNRLSGERIAQTLGQLKGAVMKVGQMASMIGDLLPQEFTSKLLSLQKDAPSVSYDIIAEQIKRELGSAPESLFDEFDEEPFASASIGQVHRAVTDDGREVIVKVQYPGVDEACDSDLTHFKLALKASGLLKLKRKAIDELFAEVRERLHEELDYCNEADNVRLFRDFHRKHPFVIIPDVVGERSSQRVLTLTYEGGDPINRLDDDDYTQEIRNLLGRNLMHFVLSQIFELQAIHADPNHANFAFRPDGSIVVYDFGCVKKMTPQLIQDYRNTLIAALEEDYVTLDNGMIALGARIPEGPVIEPEYYKWWRDILLEPFIHPHFDYSTATTHEQAIQGVPGVLKRLDSLQMPAQLFFVDRMIVGHYESLRLLRSHGDFRSILHQYLYPSGK